eukprot:gene23609-biopygen8737
MFSQSLEDESWKTVECEEPTLWILGGSSAEQSWILGGSSTEQFMVFGRIPQSKHDFFWLASSRYRRFIDSTITVSSF